MKNNKFLFLLALPLLLTSCDIFGGNSNPSKSEGASSRSDSQQESKSSEDSQGASSQSSESPSPTLPEFPDSIDELTFDNFYNPKTKLKMEFTFDPDSIYNLSEYAFGEGSNLYQQDVYHPADMKLYINDKLTEEYEAVGVRMKGNTSKDHFVDPDGTLRGNKVHFKVSFKEKFDEDPYTRYKDKDRKKRRFLGAKKFDLKWNRQQDQTFTREPYANYIMRQEGLSAQAMNLVQVTVNIRGKNSWTELYQVQECIDEEFLSRVFPAEAATGNLYKGQWDNSEGCNLSKFESVGVEDLKAGITNLRYDLKTNDSERDHSLLRNVIDKINLTAADAGGIAQQNEMFEQYVDIPYFLKYAALSWVIGNPDDLRYHDNNVYFYFPSDTNKLRIIIRDTDRCFGMINDWEGTSKILRLSPSSKENIDMWGNQVNCRLFWKCCTPVSTSSCPINIEWQNTYLRYCKEYANKYLNTNYFQAYTDAFVLAPSKNINQEKDNNKSFVQYASAKKGTINY